MREVDARPVDRRKDDVERPVAAGHPPPVPVKGRVPEVERPPAAASTSHETWGSPSPSTAGSAVSANGPASTRSQTSTGFRLSFA